MANENLLKVLERLHNRITYKKLDTDALDISRACAAGSLGTKDDYAQWAMLTNDPMVVVNYVKTFITTQHSKLTKSPFKPESDTLADLGVALRLNAMFSDTYMDVLNDGYAYLAIGMHEGVPQVKVVDARYILFNGDDPTLKDSTDVVVFEIVPLDHDDKEHKFEDYPTGYVEYDSADERVVTSHYHKVTRTDEETGEEYDAYVLDIYDYPSSEPKQYELEGLDRIPVVRFVGERVELSDKRYHYRGIYYQMSSVMKALTLSGTKVQTRVAATDDDNYIVSEAGIKNENHTWDNSGVKTWSDKDDNGGDVEKPIPIEHDNMFLIESFNLWKNVIADMLGPVVQSGSEAVTRDEVQARNEVRDALANIYMTKLSDSISEVYRCINMFMYGDNTPVVILGGYIEEVKRQKYINELNVVCEKAEKAGLNTQGIVEEYVKFADLPSATKQKVLDTIKTDPYASPMVQGLKTQIDQLNDALRKKDMQIAILQLKASTRAEHQNEYIAMLERNNNAELLFKRWQQEQKDSTSARMEVLRKALETGDLVAAKAMLDLIQQIDTTPINTAVVESVTVGDHIEPEAPITQADTARINEITQQVPTAPNGGNV